MKRLKPGWTQTDVPKRIKIELWRIIKDNPTFSTWGKAVSRFGFNPEDYDLIPTSRGSFRRLKNELINMPVEEVELLPTDLQNWVRQCRGEEPHLKQAQQNTICEQPLFEHWHRLNKLLREFETQMSVPQLSTLCSKSLENRIVISYSYIDTLQKPAIIYENESIKLGVEKSTSPPWEYLAKHLNTEFDEFDLLFTNWKNTIANLVIECNHVAKYISEQLIKREWKIAQGDFGHGVHYDSLANVLYQCAIVNEALQFKLISSESPTDLTELYARFSLGMPLIARGNSTLIKTVRNCSSRVLKARKLRESLRRINKIVADLQDWQKQLQLMIKPVLERGTFMGNCPACSDLFR